MKQALPFKVTFLLLLVGAAVVNGLTYEVNLLWWDQNPVLSYLNGSSTYQQVFNPSWILPTKSQPKTGLLIRAQNCSAKPGQCVSCPGSGSPSVLLFSELTNFEPDPVFESVSEKNIAFEPASTPESYGTEDPRVVLLPNGTYLMFYTEYGPGNIRLALASTTNPTDKDAWWRFGPVFPSLQGSKSGAMLYREEPPHYLFWGDSHITVATSYDLVNWTNQNVLISPRQHYFDSGLVESGPPPLPLSTGDYVFFHNSANTSNAYHAGWVILNGTNPAQVLQRSVEPILSPDMFPWAVGTAPNLCNVKNVVFLEAMHPIGKDIFVGYFGGSDDVIGTAVFGVTVVGS